MRPQRMMGDWGGGCLMILDIATGSGPTASETNNTASGQGQIFGKGGTNVGSGSISVGPKGKYLEQGSLDQAGQKNNTSYNLSKGATLTINQAAPLNGLGTGTQPISSLSAAPGTVPTSPAPIPPPTPTPAPTDGSSTTPTSTSGLWQNIKDHWAAWSTWQKVGAGVAGALIVWLIFHRRRA